MGQTNEPKAEKRDHILENLDHRRNDPYFWMNQRDSKEVLDYLAEENAYTEAYFQPLQALEEKLLAEFDARINPNEENAPFMFYGKQFQSRNVEGKDYEVIYLLENGREKVYFDENERAAGHSFYSLADWAPSPDHKLLAFSEDFVGRRKYTIRFRDNKNGKLLGEEITNTDGHIVWANDNKTLFYVRKDEQTLREFQVLKHVLGTDPAKDEVVYEEQDERYSVYLGKSLTRKYVEIHCYSSTTSEIRLVDADKPHSEPLVFLPRSKGHIYEVEHHTNGFYILSNDHAENNRLLFVPTIPKDLAQAEEVIPHDPEVLLENVLVLEKYIVTGQRKRGLREIEILSLADKNRKKIRFDEEAYYAGLSHNDDFYSTSFNFFYNSLTQPSTNYRYDIPNDKRSVYFEKKLADPDFKSTDYESKRVWARANDGTEIAVCLVYRKGTDLSKAPLLLYGYGSYGITIPDVFSATRLSLLDRGFVYAIAHIRGSKYLGEDWYRTGKFLHKKNTFTDFINCAEYLAMQGYCDPERIYAQGGSAGGLLMGAVANMAPYLWKGIVAQVPFVDVVTTMLDESIPLTVGEYEEWGNPNETDYYYYMLSYSPYDNVRKMDYPAMYITTGYHDSQVQYWEPAKWVARLREKRTNNNALLFDCNMDAGHGGGSGRSTERREIAREFAFILNQEGIAL